MASLLKRAIPLALSLAIASTTTSTSLSAMQQPQQPTSTVTATLSQTPTGKNTQTIFDYKLPAGQMPLMPTIGLTNPSGSRCYANAVLQCLFAIPPLMVHVSTMAHSNDPIIEGFRQLVQGKIAQATTHTKAFDYPAGMYEAMTNKSINANAYFDDGNQHNAYDFFIPFIRTLDNQTNMFHGISSETTCIQCNNKTVCKEPEVCSEINLPETSPIVLINHILEAQHSNCPNCKGEKTANREFIISKLPTVLAIHLKREYLKQEKNLTQVHIADSIRIETKSPTQQAVNYTLVGMVMHSGRSIRDGHYFALVKNTNNRTWYKCDDETITPFPNIDQLLTSGHGLKTDETPTMLFYVDMRIIRCYTNAAATTTKQTPHQAPLATNNSATNAQKSNVDSIAKVDSPTTSSATKSTTTTAMTLSPTIPIVTTTYSSSGITTTNSAPSLQLHQPTEIKPPSKEDAKLATNTQRNTSAQTITAPNTPLTATQTTDEKKQPSYFPCTLPDGKMPWLNTTGLDNPGVACYASSVMQCLFAIDPLMINIMRMETKDPVVTGFKQLVATKITQSDTDEKTGNKTASHKYPTDLYNNINLQFFNGNATSPQPVRQQDAQEFYVKLIEALGDTGNLFRSTASSSITCSVCHHKKVTQETLIVDQKEHNPSCINLAVPSNVTRTSLRTLLDDYFKTETLDGTNAYKCPQCKNSTKASKRLLIDQLPAVLTIHLSRFDMQHGFFKNLTPVTFPLGLTIKNEYLTQPTQTPVGYTLVGVVIHHGWVRANGHYIAITKNAGNQTWYECNDSKIKCPQQEAIAQFASLGYWQGEFLADPKATAWQRGIYTPTLLFYVRNDVMSKYGNGISEPTPEEKDVKQALPPLVLTQELAQALNSAFAGTQATQTYTSNAQSDLYINQQLYMLLIDAIQTGRVADVKMLLAGLMNNIYTNNNLYVDLVTQTHLTVQQRLRNLQAIFKLLPPATATTTTIDKKIWDEMVAAITAADVSNATRLMTSFTTRLATHDGKKTLEAHFVETYRAAKGQLLNMDQIAQLFQSLA